MDSPTISPTPTPSIFNYIIGFLLIGLAWGFTTPFIRAAARTHNPPSHPILLQTTGLKKTIYGAFFGVIDLLKNPRYAVPLLINLTGSVWFFLLIGKAGTQHYFPFLSFGMPRVGDSPLRVTCL